MGVLAEAAPRLPQGGHIGEFPTGGGTVAADIADDGAGNGQAVHHLTGVGERVVTLGPLDPVTKHRAHHSASSAVPTRSSTDPVGRSASSRAAVIARWRAARVTLSRSRLVTIPSSATESSSRDATCVT